jgi:hypothetical protein
MATKKTKQLCQGCHNNFYNSGAKGCWSFGSAEAVTRTRVGTWQNPPYTWQPEVTLSCHSPEGTTWIERDDPRLVEPATS